MLQVEVIATVIHTYDASLTLLAGGLTAASIMQVHLLNINIEVH